MGWLFFIFIISLVVWGVTRKKPLLKEVEEVEYFPEQHMARATFKARRLKDLPYGIRSPKTMNQLFNRQLFGDAMKIIYKILDSCPSIEKIRVEALDNLVDIYGNESEGPILSIETERNEIVKINRKNFDVAYMYDVCSVIFETNDQYLPLKIIKTHTQLEKEGIKIPQKTGHVILEISREKELAEMQRERIPEEVKQVVWRRDKGRCAECGGRKKLEFHHIIPVSKGGGNTARNIELLCEKCNRKKLDKI